MSEQKYPQTWKHKENGKTHRVCPWWEMMPGTEINDKDIGDPIPGTPWKFGMLIQVGWLLENEHGVWFGVGPDAKEFFEVVEKEKK